MTMLAQAAYAHLLRPLLFRLDPETAHRLTIGFLRALPAFAPGEDPLQLATSAMGLEFAAPLGLAAGMDKDALAAHAWRWLGFSFVEFGTVTPRPQPGNPRPRLFRLPEHRSLINRLGFPSDGAEAVAARLQRVRRLRSALRFGVNFGPNRETPPHRVADDYAILARTLAPLADFVVVNVSSPNTPGLRDFQTAERLGEIVSAMRSVRTTMPPILVKLSPDLDREQLAALCESAEALALAGIVACNTTVARTEIGVAWAEPGGLSGGPLRDRARDVIRHLRSVTRGRLTIVGVGGVASAEDAYGHIRAGANLVELYTGLVYEGPGLVRRIKSGLVRLLRRDGFSSISDAVGCDVA